MIITRTPFRVSFVGGGTDLPDFYKVEPGAVVSTAIDKYMYIVVNKRFDRTIRVSYSRTEIVDTVDEIQHPIVREAMKVTGTDGGVEIVSIADIPAGTGLGSSGCFTVGLLHALYSHQRVLRTPEQLASEACRIEMETLGEPVGKQDQYIAAYGGLRYFQFNPDGTVFTEPIVLGDEMKAALDDGLCMFYTGDTRLSSAILSEQKANTARRDRMDSLVKMRDLARELKEELSNHRCPDTVGSFLHRNWLLKRGLATNISNPLIDRYYDAALEAGASGGKILGAGGGGFLLLHCPRERQARLRQALCGLPLIDFALEPEGSRIIHAH